jgi:pilus assembly protein CpaC
MKARTRRNILLASVLLVLGAGYTLANVDEEKIRLIAGQTKIFSTRAPTRVVIGNPQVADVVDVTNNEITVNAKSAGTTTLVYWDAYGEQSLELKVLPEDTQELKRRIDYILSKLNADSVYTKTAEEEGRVMLLGSVKALKDKERILAALAPLKEKYTDLIEIKEEEAVIEINVQVLELNTGAAQTLGFTWPGAINLIEKGSAGISDAGSKFGTLFTGVRYQRGTAVGPDPYTFKLDLLIQEGQARVLSHPRLACQSGKEAKLLVGGEVPIISASVGSGGSTAAPGAAQPGNVEYKEYGIILKVKPTVDGVERIHLALNVEVSEVQLAEKITTTYAVAYPFTKRSASTELYLEDGQTMALGGLVKQKTEEELRKFPWLADLPVLGMFFRKRSITTGSGSTTKGDTELFITLTPKIISRGRQPLAVTAEAESVKSAPLSEIGSGALGQYAGIIQKRILHNLKYPALAKNTGFQGTVILRLHLSYLGELLGAAVKESSGYEVLDEQTLKITKGIGFYPPFPPAISAKDIWIDVPVEYRLD